MRHASLPARREVRETEFILEKAVDLPEYEEIWVYEYV
jgi:hypothetical protein